MKKLVSKNPVLRFKLGKKLLKGLRGTLLSLIGREILKTEAERPLFETGTVEYGPNGLRNKSTNDIVNAYAKNMTPELRRAVEDEIAVENWMKYNNSKANINATNRYVPQQTPVVRRKSQVNNIWLKGFGKIPEVTNVRLWLNKLKDFYEPGKFVVDGKWGQNTQNAYIRWQLAQALKEAQNNTLLALDKLNESIMDIAYNKSKNNVIYPFSGKTLPTPDFGYYSNGTYGLDNPNWIKKSGIKDLTSLLDYITANSNSNLALDILHYGGLELLEKDAGISGHYGRRDRKRLNNFLAGLSQGFRDGYMDRVRAFDKQYDLYKSGGTLVSRNPIIRFKNGSSFGKAFRQARNQGLREFTWNGKRYTTKLKEEAELKNSDNISNKLLSNKMKQDIYNDSINGNYEKGIRTFYSPSGRKAEIIRKKPILTHY